MRNAKKIFGQKRKEGGIEIDLVRVMCYFVKGKMYFTFVGLLFYLNVKK